MTWTRTEFPRTPLRVSGGAIPDLGISGTHLQSGIALPGDLELTGALGIAGETRVTGAGSWTGPRAGKAGDVGELAEGAGTPFGRFLAVTGAEASSLENLRTGMIVYLKDERRVAVYDGQQFR